MWHWWCKWQVAILSNLHILLESLTKFQTLAFRQRSPQQSRQGLLRTLPEGSTAIWTCEKRHVSKSLLHPHIMGQSRWSVPTQDRVMQKQSALWSSKIFLNPNHPAPMAWRFQCGMGFLTTTEQNSAVRTPTQAGNCKWTMGRWWLLKCGLVPVSGTGCS